jgi:hypothetical protein
MQNKKNLLIAALVILVILAGALLWAMNKTAPALNNGASGGEQTEDTTFGSVNEGKAPVAYAAALSQYQSARIAFDEACKATPARLTLTNGSPLMIDNTSQMDRVVVVGTPTNVRANSFKIVKVAGNAAGAQLAVDCDQSKNVAAISAR